MGNSTSEIVQRVSEMSLADLEKHMKKDLELLQDLSVIHSSSKLAIRNDLNCYKIAGHDPSSKRAEPPATSDEQSLLCSLSTASDHKELQDRVVKNLIDTINLTTEVDIATGESIKKLQAICRIFEAVLRIEEKRAKSSGLDNKSSSEYSLPASSKLAIKFALATLLNLIESVADLNPGLFELVLNDANQLLSSVPPLSMQSQDSAIIQSFFNISVFFDSVASGKIKNLSQDVAHKSYGPILKLGLGTGNLPSFLLFVNRLFDGAGFPPELVQDLYPSLRTLHKMPNYVNLFLWSSTQKSASLTVVENEVVPAGDNGSSTIYIENVFSSDKFYIEIIASKITNDTCFGISDVSFTSTSSWNDSNIFTCTYSANSTVFLKAN